LWLVILGLYQGIASAMPQIVRNRMPLQGLGARQPNLSANHTQMVTFVTCPW
jgi:hypothetical protein